MAAVGIGRSIARVALAVLLLGAGATSLCAQCAQPARPAADVALVDVEGKPFQLSVPGERRAMVVVFIGHDCPISNSYAPEIERLWKEFGREKVAFCVVYADADLAREDASKHAKEYGFTCPAVFDPGLTLARRVGATIKPEAAVLSPEGKLLYLGRIDNRYPELGQRRDRATQHDLRDAIAAILAGKPVAKSRTTAVGCDIVFPETGGEK
jgi:hypothetical protein